jgi:hypothetical protein
MTLHMREGDISMQWRRETKEERGEERKGNAPNAPQIDRHPMSLLQQHLRSCVHSSV